MGLIPREIVDTIRESTDIVQLIGEYVRLQKKGKNYVGNCPFHQEKDPSFTVTPDKQIFYCFGCQAGGNVFKFLMLFEKLTFQEAVRRLADRAGIFIPDTTHPRDRKKAAQEEWAWKTNQLVTEYYQDMLYHHPESGVARDYLRNRGLTDAVIHDFQVGYAPAGWDNLFVWMKKKGYTPKELLALGLVVENRKGGLYDRFRERIMFPVANAQGKVVGFGGRLLVDGQPKYLNSPETAVFEKSKTLFGLSQAKHHIREKNQAIMMEGYMDVVAAHQFGISNAVASLGTSFTKEQGKLLLRYTNHVILAFDADRAGILATMRGLDLLQEVGISPGVITIPDGKDPDGFLRAHGLESWEQLVLKATSLLDYKLDQLLKEGKNRTEALMGILANLAMIPEGAQLEEGIQTVSARLALSWDAVKEELQRFRGNKRKIWQKTDIITKNTHNTKREKIFSPELKAERGLLQLLLENPDRMDFLLEELQGDFWKDARHQQIYQVLKEQRSKGSFEPAQAMDLLSEPAAVLMGELLLKSSNGDPEKAMADCIAVIKKDITDNRRAQLLQELAEAERAEDLEKMNILMQRIQNLR